MNAHLRIQKIGRQPNRTRAMTGRAIAATVLIMSLPAANAQLTPAQLLGPPTPNAPVLSGAVIGSDGARIQAIVTAYRLDPGSDSASAQSAPDGSFSLVGLQDGTYQLCAEDKDGRYLDPCAWSDSQVTVTLRGAQPIRSYRLVLTRGADLEVRVADAGKVLDAIDPVSKAPRASLVLAAVTPRNILQPLRLAATTGAVRNHRIAVKPGAKIFLGVLGNGLSMNDSQGRPIQPGRAVSFPITIPAGPGPPTAVSFTVTGARP